MSDSATLTPDALRPRQPAGMGAGLLLALLAHALLIAALTLGLRWKASDPAGIEAELWAAVPQVAAPRAAAPEPVPVEAKKPEPPPPEPKPPEPVAKVEPTPQQVLDAQIAIEKAKLEEEKREVERREAEKLEQQRLKEEREQQQRLKEEREQQRVKEERERQRLKEEREQQRTKQELEEKRAKEELERKKKEQAAKAKLEAQRLADAREANLKRIQGQAGATGAPSDKGTAARTAGPSSGYAGRIKARVQPNIVFADSVDGNPLATVEVRLAPDGTIIAKRLVKSSGLKAWDDAVLRAIDKTEQLPRDVDGRVPPVLEIDFRPHD
ncbi:MAG: cell envelope integrity protein TolA [Rhizobacter sp.]|nr:cell envelope integrity protein TolA [Rhizobacter sp.]